MSPTYVPIDETVAARIQALNEKHPKLGHHGLLKALNDEGIKVHPEELERFMKEHHIAAEKPWRPWRWRGAPGWLGGSPKGDL
jgi:hypothetical protein